MTLESHLADLRSAGTPFTVLVDQDDVIAAWTDGFYREFGLRYPGVKIVAKEDRDRFDIFREEDLHAHQQILDLMNLPGFYRNLEPLPGAVEALHLMVESGLDVAICTAPWLTNPTCAGDKLEWMDRVVGPGWSEKTIITRDKTRVRGRLLFDDRDKVTGACIPEWEHIIVDFVHNRHITDKRRVMSLAGWRDAVEETLLATVSR